MLVYAAGATTPTPVEGPGALYPFIMMGLMFLVLYFVAIRPQKKKEKKMREMIAALKIGDEVASIGGIHGKITRIKDDVFVLETGIGTTKSFITIERNAISRVVKEGAVKEKELEPLPDEAETNQEEA